jgi:hypothetical protein
MAGWNLALRFGLEVAAVAGLAVGAWKLTSGNIRWIAAIAVPSIAVAIWGVFNVLDDPSRSGAAPVEVSGVSRLAIELLILGGSVAALAIVGHHEIAFVLAALIAVHYITSWTRIEWLVQA